MRDALQERGSGRLLRSPPPKAATGLKYCKHPFSILKMNGNLQVDFRIQFICNKIMKYTC